MKTKKTLLRRSFLQNIGLGSLGVSAVGGWCKAAEAQVPDENILGATGVETSDRPQGVWQPVSDRKIRVGVVGYGACKFGAAFGFQDHPNVTVAAVSDLFPDRCSELAKKCRCEKTYPSLEELVKDDTIEAVFLATDAPSHAQHCIDSLQRGKHVACCVPAVWGSIEDAHKLFEAVKVSGKKYMMYETSTFHPQCWAMRQIYRAGGFGKLLYTEGEYWHYGRRPTASYRDWRVGAPLQWYPTHSNAYYISVTDGSFTEVSCLGATSEKDYLQPGKNAYQNTFGTEVALMQTSEGGTARMLRGIDVTGLVNEMGRVYGQRGYMVEMNYQGEEKNLPNLERPPLPPGVAPGGHRGSHGPLTEEFTRAILEDRKPVVDIVAALNMTVPGIIAHQSALKGGESMKIPQFA